MPITYADRDGNPIDAQAWVDLRADRAYRIVAHDNATAAGVAWSIETVWNGIRVADRDAPQLVASDHMFLTTAAARLRRDDRDLGRVWQFRTLSLHGATFLHTETVDAVRAGRLTWETTDPMYAHPNIPMRYFMGVPA